MSVALQMTNINSFPHRSGGEEESKQGMQAQREVLCTPWPTSARNENHNSDSKVPLWGLITAVTGRGYSHPELPQMLLFNQEWMNIVWDVLLIQCLAERHFD